MLNTCKIALHVTLIRLKKSIKPFNIAILSQSRDLALTLNPSPKLDKGL
jgi:hypothetical protein